MASFEICACHERQPVTAFASEPKSEGSAAAPFDLHALLQVRKGATLFYKVCSLLEPVSLETSSNTCRPQLAILELSDENLIAGTAGGCIRHGAAFFGRCARGAQLAPRDCEFSGMGRCGRECARGSAAHSAREAPARALLHAARATGCTRFAAALRLLPQALICPSVFRLCLCATNGRHVHKSTLQVVERFPQRHSAPLSLAPKSGTHWRFIELHLPERTTLGEFCFA